MKKILKYSHSKNQKQNIFSREISDILKGITDIIKVYNTDYTIAFFNEAGYKFYKKEPEEVIGKRCFEILDRNSRCENCPFEEIMNNKKMVVTERYIPELNKFMDVCCNPVMDEQGNIIFIVERLKDITEAKILDFMLKESEGRYRQIVNSFPEPVIIIQDNRIVLANKEACNFLQVEYSKFIGDSIYKYLPKRYLKIIHKRIRDIIKNNKTNMVYNFKFNCFGNRPVEIQTSSSAISYNVKPAVLSVITDVSNIKKDLNKAAELQKMSLQKVFSMFEKVEMASVYFPANIVSGDFYRFYKVNDSLTIGILIDVSGKGIVAALSISAFDVLFHQEVAINNDPMHIVNNLNKKCLNYFGENYVAVACFSMDFKKNELKVVGAGINHFIFQKGGQPSEERIIKGPFLGMFEEGLFDEEIISFEKGDRIFFFTDGLDFIVDEDKVIQKYMESVTIKTFAKYINEFLDDTLIDLGHLKDDCTMIALEIK